MKKSIPILSFGIVLLIFTVYIVLDTFVLSSGQQIDTTQINTNLFDEVTTPVTDIDEFSNENFDIKLTEYNDVETRIYVADIKLKSAQYLKTAFANDKFGKNIDDLTSTIATQHGAVLAINGDYYGIQEKGYVIRNGILYRNSDNDHDVCCIYPDGDMTFYKSGEKTAEELINDRVWHAFSFGPGLIKDGEISISTNEEVAIASPSNPRTAIGLIEKNHFVFVVSDGRTDESKGLTLYELATFMKKLGVKTAYNLDGGGSSTMWFQGKLINKPTTTGVIVERDVSDIVYIG